MLSSLSAPCPIGARAAPLHHVVMVVVQGRMLFNGRWCETGSLIFVPAREEYWYSTGEEACRVALIRPKGRGTFENGLEATAGNPAKPESADKGTDGSADDATR